MRSLNSSLKTERYLNQKNNWNNILKNGKKIRFTMQEIFTFCFLVKPATPEVVGDNHIRHRVENKLDVLCVGGAGHVAVNLLRRRLVLRLKLGLVDPQCHCLC